MRKFQYFLILFIALSFAKSVNSQNALKCGLFTNFSLNNKSKIKTRKYRTVIRFNCYYQTRMFGGY